SAARGARRGHGRHRHGARRRPATDLPAARPCRPLAGAHRARPPSAPARNRARLRRRGDGAELGGDAAGGRIDVAAALQALGARGLTRLLVEGGGTLAAALLAAGLVDRLVWLRAPP